MTSHDATYLRLRLNRPAPRPVAGMDMADELLDIAQERDLFAVTQRDCDPACSGARGTADAVDVGFGHVRQVEIDHVADAIDIDAARRDIGGDENSGRAFAKCGKHALALVLGFIAVDRVGGHAGLDQAAHDLVGAVLGSGEDQRTIDRLALQDVDEGGLLGCRDRRG